MDYWVTGNIEPHCTLIDNTLPLSSNFCLYPQVSSAPKGRWETRGFCE